jgi:menaquinone-dependent protoporphyrinogen oxidase
MKPIGIFYATREGHTARIADHLADVLRAQGWRVRVCNVRESPANLNLSDYRAAILAASVHTGEHEPEMVKFARENVDALEALPAAFLSVTLSEAGAERRDATPEERARFSADVEKVIHKFFEETNWHPKKVQPVAGALLYTKYNILIRFIMKRIARKAGADTDTSRDHVYTDWVALDRFAEEFLKEL